MRTHFFLAIPLLISLFPLTVDAETLPEGTLLNLKPLLEEVTNARISNMEHGNDPILLHGQYHLFGFVMRSVNISILGTQSASITSNGAGDYQEISDSTHPSMMIISNSTVELSSLRLICHGEHCSVATLHQSTLSISNSEISPASNVSPFLSTWTLADTSMVTVVDTQVSWKHATSLPLVGTMAHDDKCFVTELSKNSILGRDTDQTRGTLSIIGSGLSFKNTALPLATGPLFDFGFIKNTTQRSMLAASVSLTTSALTNVTSGRRLIGDTQRFPVASQGVICSSISECRNHLYGTGLLDMNFGSGVCCLNSSFSRCESDADPTEGPPAVYLQHRTTHFDQKVSPTFTSFDTCTFSDIHADRGGAIDSLQAGSSLSVTACSFVGCSATRMAGSIFVYPSPSTCSIAVSRCSFVSGVAGDQAGAMQISYGYVTSMTDCVFLNLTSSTFGGALNVNKCPGPVTLSNCLLQKCKQTSTAGDGGAIDTENSKFTFRSLRFRDNSATTLDHGHDLYFKNFVKASMDASSITDCDTDQETIVVYFFNCTGSITPNLVAAPNSLIVSSVSCVASLDSRTAKASLEVDQPIDGTVLMLIDDTNAYEKPNDDSPPSINRMISFDFSSDSTSLECELSFGEWELLQYEANYSLVAFGWKESIVDTNNAVLATPNPPRIVRATCEGGNWEFDAFLSLKARTLGTGSYKVSVKGKSEFWMVVDFVSSGSGGNIFSTKAGVKLQGSDGILDFETRYEIDEVIEISTGESLILDPPRLFFTTPSRPSLTSVGAIAFSDTQKDVVTIKLVGEKLIASPYTLTVSDGSATSTLTAVFDADGMNGEATAVVYSMDGSETIELAFGKTYTIAAFACHFNRIERLLNKVEVTFQARALPSSISKVTITGQDPSVFVSATRLSATSFSALFNVAATASLNSLVFGETYSIASVSNGTELLLNDDVAFKVPSNVRVTAIHPTFSNTIQTGLTLNVEVEGPIHNSKYKLTLTDDIEVEVECSGF
ncbi:hypothetical protein BLNAU_21231 [Blattamonas nauphoetae]|uniref:Uncharacterized protein n=1 Tax=Blattamonas nauphoetae TaxID=2049346 RepID=A0ABQ9X0M4_9EUKA|nr:hypothetical protein BLNAU_21231 [Blattamonas nauphoetae]